MIAACDAQWLKRFTKVELEEPEEAATLEIVQKHAQQLAEEFQLEITPEVVERTVVLTSHFLLSERHPAKAIRLLRQVCEDLEFDRSERGAETQQVQLNDIIDALAERTGIPSDTLSGNAIQDDFETALTAAVVGQDPAIAEVTEIPTEALVQRKWTQHFFGIKWKSLKPRQTLPCDTLWSSQKWNPL